MYLLCESVSSKIRFDLGEGGNYEYRVGIQGGHPHYGEKWVIFQLLGRWNTPIWLRFYLGYRYTNMRLCFLLKGQHTHCGQNITI